MVEGEDPYLRCTEKHIPSPFHVSRVFFSNVENVGKKADIPSEGTLGTSSMVGRTLAGFALPLHPLGLAKNC